MMTRDQSYYSWAEIIARRALYQSDSTAFTYLIDGESVEDKRTYQELYHRITSIGSHLIARLPYQSRALILVPQGLTFIETFLSCLCAGMIAVPVYVPKNTKQLKRITGILTDAITHAVLWSDTLTPRLQTLFAEQKLCQDAQWYNIDDISDNEIREWPALSEDSTALLQYTSGSTGSPKGVILTHGNLLVNQRMIQQVFRHTKESSVAGCLPMYHDMGLIGNVLQPIFMGIHCVLLSPMHVIQQPIRWLSAISKYKVTTSGGPNSFYDFCSNRVKDEQLELLDLSSWYVAFNGSEPVRSDSLEAFSDKFRKCGFKASSFLPCYGLAEASLLVSGGGRVARPNMRYVEKSAYYGGELLNFVDKSDEARPIVGCGEISKYVQVVVVDVNTGSICRDKEVGEIWIRGQSVSQGYWGRKDSAFSAYLNQDQPVTYFRTGDLGFVSDQELFIVGRLKELIINNGRNYYPADIENTISNCHPMLAEHLCAVFSHDGFESEDVIVVQEINHRAEIDANNLFSAIHKAVWEEYEIKLADVILVSYGAIPRTTSGKKKRVFIREQYFLNKLNVFSRSETYYNKVTKAREACKKQLDNTQFLSFKDKVNQFEEIILNKLTQVCHIESKEISPFTPLGTLGLESLTVLELSELFYTSANIKIPLSYFFDGKSIRDLANYLSSQRCLATTGEPSTITGSTTGIDEPYSLSKGQLELWFRQQMHPSSSQTTVSRAITVEGMLDLNNFKAAACELVRIQPILRTVFGVEENEPYQIILPSIKPEIHTIDVQHWTQAQIDDYLNRHSNISIPLNNRAPWCFHVLKKNSKYHVLLLAFHHAVCDIYTINVLIEALFGIYYQLAKVGFATVSTGRAFSEFVRCQQLFLSSVEVNQQCSFWRNTLKGTSFKLNLLTKIPEQQVPSPITIEQTLTVNENITKSLKQLSRQNGSTLSIVCLTCLFVILHKYTGQERFSIGVPASGRRQPNHDLLGYMVNLLPIVADLSKATYFNDLLNQIKKNIFAALENSDLPFALISQEYIKHTDGDIDSDQGLDVAFVYQNSILSDGQNTSSFALNVDGGSVRIGELTLSSVSVSNPDLSFPLTCSIGVVNDKLVIKMQWREDLYYEKIVKSLLSDYIGLLDSIGKEQTIHIKKLCINPLQAIQHNISRLLQSDESVGGCLHIFFKEQVEKFPHRIAVADGDFQLSYRELDLRSSQLAVNLLESGLCIEDRVGIFLDRSAGLIVAMLGILKAGGAYVPIDPDLPKERINYLINDAELNCLVISSSFCDRIDEVMGVDTVILEHIFERESIAPSNCQGRAFANILPNNLAYLLYTSGTTGKPKGVLVSHNNVNNLFNAVREHIDIKNTDTWTLFHSPSFDVSVWEIWGALLFGGKLVIVPKSVSREPSQFLDLLHNYMVTMLSQTPTAYQQLVNTYSSRANNRKLAVRMIFFAGERLDYEKVDGWISQCLGRSAVHINMYGITETTVHATVKRIGYGEQNDSSRSFIGNPLSSYKVCLLDAQLNSVPLGAPGQIFVGGAGVARGYWKKPAETAMRFIPDMTGNAGDRLYVSGDLARLYPNKELEYLGRFDEQVKINGFRIELGEIVFQMLRHPNIEDAAVRVRRYAGSDVLIAYYIERVLTVSPDELRQQLYMALPGYMVPHHFVKVDHFPVTDNGKKDYEKLPLPSNDRPNYSPTFMPPRSSLERQLVDIWQSVLAIDHINVKDSFFSLGGDSIKSIKVVAEAQKLGIELSVDNIFRLKTIENLANLYVGRTPSVEKLPEIKPFALLGKNARIDLPENIIDAYPLSMIQKALIFQADFSDSYEIYVTSLRIRSRFSRNLLKKAINRLVASHDFLRASFQFSETGEPLQIIHASLDVPLYVVDLRSLSDRDRKKRVKEWIETEKKFHFNWMEAPHIRFNVHLLEDSLFQFTMSEVSLDGWCVATLMTELFSDYTNLLAGRVTTRTPPAATYSQFVAAERRAISDPEHQNFWRAEIGEGLHQNLPRWKKTSLEPARHCRLNYWISNELTEKLKSFASNIDVPFRSVLLAAHCRVLFALTGTREVVSGLELNGRPEAEDGDRLIGAFNNILPFKLKVDSWTWEEFVKKIYEKEQKVMAFRRYPYVQLSRDNNNNPLFEAVFVYTNFYIYNVLRSINGFEVEEHYASDHTYIPLTTHFNEDILTGNIQLLLEFGTDDFPEEQIQQVERYYINTLLDIASNPDRLFYANSILPEPERADLLSNKCAKMESDNTCDIACFNDLLRYQTELNGNAIALVHDKQKITYGDLYQRVVKMAKSLQKLGVGPEVVVSLYMRRTPDLIIAMLSIIHAGGAYLGIDPDYPYERAKLLLDDSASSVLIVDAESHRTIKDTQLLWSNKSVKGFKKQGDIGSMKVFTRNDPCQFDHQNSGQSTIRTFGESNLAYIIYTSGSTGIPNGVCIEHHGLSALLHWARYNYSQDELSQVLASTSICFDLSIFEIFVPLAFGGSVALIDSALSLVDCQYAQSISLINTVPTAIRELNTIGAIPPSVKTINLAGEFLSSIVVDDLYDNTTLERVYDLYGPSEDTTYSTYALRKARAPANIGFPILNTFAYILDDALNLVPTGTPGLLYLSGMGLSRGYFQRPKLTAEKFIPNPFSETTGERMYNTGDLVRHTVSGELEYIGRADFQSKIRGYRVEPNEIETMLVTHEWVVDAAVVVDSIKSRLVAFVVPKDEQRLDFDDILRSYLSNKLPSYMLPSVYHILSELPLTLNGKLDRKKLISYASEIKSNKSSQTFVSPITSNQIAIANIWAQVLGVEKVGLDDDFFELGGDSILSIQIVARARAQGLNFTYKTLFQNSTIHLLCENIASYAPDEFESSVEERCAPLTPIQHWFFEYASEEAHYWNQSVTLTFCKKVGRDILNKCIQELWRIHSTLRMRFLNDIGTQHWYQDYVSPDIAPQVEWIDLSHLRLDEQNDHMRRAERERHTSFKLDRGPLIRFIHFNLGDDQASRFLTIAHHLIMDGVSFRILVDDLNMALNQSLKNEPITLLSTTCSYKRWATKLKELTQNGAFIKDTEHWQNYARVFKQAIPIDHENSWDKNTMGSVRSIPVVFNQQESQTIVQVLPARFNCHINSIFLVAIAKALYQSFSISKVGIDIESHGRDFEGNKLDVSRTIGWFTSIYPFLLEFDPCESDLSNLMRIDQRLKEVPENGVSFSALRYLSDEPTQSLIGSESKASLSFNYLGQIRVVEHSSAVLKISNDSIGAAHSSSNKRPNLIQLQGALFGNRLKFDWFFSKYFHNPSTIDHLAKNFISAINHIIKDLSSTEVLSHNISELLFVPLKRHQIESIEKKVGIIEEVFPLTPMQEGILSQCLSSESEIPPYLMQVVCIVEGNMDVSLFETVWNCLIERHSSLRTSFHWINLERPVQIVQANVKLTVELVDLRDALPTAQLAAIKMFKDKDRRLKFNIDSHRPLMRVTLFWLRDNTYQCVWTHHHLQLDGWSQQIILKELFYLYGKTIRNIEYEILPPPPLIRYFDWTEKHKHENAELFWRNYLSGFKKPSSLCGVKEELTEREFIDSFYDEIDVIMSEEESKRCQQFLRMNRITLNTFFQAVWSLWLHIHNDNEDVVFGNIVSGRSSNIESIEHMVGVFINVLPVKVSLKTKFGLLEWMKKIQSQQVESLAYESTPISTVKRFSGVSDGARLFESILVIENLPDKYEDIIQEGDFRIKDIEFYIQENYPIVIIVQPGVCIEVKIKYDTKIIGEESNFIGESILFAIRFILENENLTLDKIGNAVKDEYIHYLERESFKRRLKASDSLAVAKRRSILIE